jgi:hypothetical protein
VTNTLFVLLVLKYPDLKDALNHHVC